MRDDKRIKGARDLLFDSVEIVTNLVEKTHGEVSHRWTERAASIEPLAPIVRGGNAIQMATAAMTCAAVRFANRGVATLARAVTDPFLDEGTEQSLRTPMRDDARGSLSWSIDHAEGTINGFVGHHLAQRDNSLDLGMTLRREGCTVSIEAEALRAAFPDATRKVAVFVHGLSATEWSWVLSADRLWGDPESCYGTKLYEQLGYTPLFVRYNTGRHVSENGGSLSELLEAVTAAYPEPIEEIALVGHSMGGLVVRSAAHYGARSQARWSERLRHVFCIGAPHLGAPLAKGANVLSAVLRRIPAAGATVPAAILGARSDGIRDLEHGYTTDEEWLEHDAEAVLHDSRHDVPLVDGVGYYAVAATITKDPDHPAGRLLGDLLVRAPSASGVAREPERHVAFHSRQLIPGMTHLHLANHPAVYEMLVKCLHLPCSVESRYI